MPDFLSRLVERSFGLVAVAQPVTHSIFAPEHPVKEHPVKSDYTQGFAHDSESVGNQSGVNIDSSRKNSTEIIPQNDYQPLLNMKKPSKDDEAKLTAQVKDLDNQIHFASTTRPLHNVEPLNEPLIELLKQNDSGTQEQIESVPLKQMSKQDNRYLDTPPADMAQYLAQYKVPLYKIYSDTLESVESELLHVKNWNDRSTLRLIPKSILNEEQFHEGKQDSQEHLEPFVDSVNSLSGKTLMDHISNSGLTSGSSSSLKSGESLEQNSEPTSRADFGQTSRADFYSPGYLHPDSRSSPIIPGKQNLKRVSTPKVNATLEQTGNMLIEQHAAAPKPPSTVPIIKVTIGRIEVKAVKPPQEPQPQTPPKGSTRFCHWMIT